MAKEDVRKYISTPPPSLTTEPSRDMTTPMKDKSLLTLGHQVSLEKPNLQLHIAQKNMKRELSLHCLVLPKKSLLMKKFCFMHGKKYTVKLLNLRFKYIL